jgi:hypothetical protein
MTSQNLLDRGELDEKAVIKGSSEWNASLISRKPVRMEYVRDPTESEAECQKRVMAALWIFLALLIVFSGAAVCLLWAKVHGLF